MAKIDVRKDYYGDLGIAPGANTEEIKKQFRKLALIYHPDRNPGKEAESISKFQAIQAAHEILTDSQQRLKYDTERLRAGYGRLYAPPSQPSASRRGNTSSSAAYTSAAKGSTPKTPRPTSYQPPPSGSAQRYASYAKAAPQQTYEYEQKQARADAYRGFQAMPGWAKFNPTNGKTGPPPPPPTRSNTTAGASTQSSRRSAYDHVNSRPHPAAFGRSASSATKKKQGFAPGNPGGDEPMARNVSAYANTPRPERTSAFFDSAPSPTARRTPTSSRPETPLDDPVPEFERMSHPYARTGGERTYFNSAGLSRAYTMRDSSSSRARSRTNPPSPTSPVSSRHRSASPKYKTFSSSSSSLSSEEETDSDDDDVPTFVPRQKATPRSRLRPTQKFHFQGPGSGEEIPGHFKAPQYRSTRRLRGHFGEDRRHSDYEFQGHSTDSDHYQGHDSDSAFVFKAPQHANFIDPTRQGPTGVTGSNERNHNAENTPSSGAKSKSHDNLSQRFSASQWDDAFKADLFAPNRSNGHQRSRSRTSPMRGRAARRTNAETQSNVNSSSDEAARQQASWMKSQFSAEEWAQRFQNTNWATPNPNSEPSQSQPQAQPKTSAAKSGRKISRPTSRTTRPQQPAVSTEAEENEATVSDLPSKASTPMPDAMDIDEESSQPAKTQPNGVKRTQPAVPKPKGGVPIGNSGKTSEQTGISLNLGPLHNVAPFTNTNSGGIDDLKDMFTTLPFESRAHDPNVKRSMAQNRKFDLPSPPTRPPKPATVSPNGDPRNMVLPRQSWELYVRQINAYITEWNKFQRNMLQILTVRQVAFESGLAPRWVDAIGDSIQLNVTSEAGSDTGTGDTDGSEAGNQAEILIPDHPHGGYKAYTNALEEHARIRAHWDIACERHQECILQLGEIREWIRTKGKIV